MDVSSPASLKKFDCNYNKLKYLNLTDNRNLRELYCDINMLTSLELSGNLALKILDCNANQLGSLDVSPAVEWWNDRREITVDDAPKAKKYSAEDIAALGYNIDLCGFPHREEAILAPLDLIRRYEEERSSLNAEIDRVLADMSALLGEQAE